jgi:hypothetical protein
MPARNVDRKIDKREDDEYGLNITQLTCYVFFNTQKKSIYGINL